jgi:CRP-like cAMP-binding protein
LLTGSVDVTKLSAESLQSRIAVVQAGHALGEMSMLDGEPRFSSCTALEKTRFAVLTRDSLVEVIKTEPRLGAKIMLTLVHILAQRLRNTSRQLVKSMETSRQARA